MNIEEVREFALGLNEAVTEDMFTENWISWRIFGKWFMLMQLDAPEPRVAVKLPPEVGLSLREKYSGVCPAFHMNKTHWNSVKAEGNVPDDVLKDLLEKAYRIVLGSLSKKKQKEILND